VIIRPHPKSKEPTAYKWRGRVLKGTVNRHGYFVVGLGGNNVKKIHNLIALTYLGERPLNSDVRHLNGIRTDNRLENLSYGSRSENHLDRYTYGNPIGLFSSDGISQIRNLLSKPKPCLARIARQFGVTPGAIAHIQHGRTYKWLK
jgi:hypothetical protein